MNRRKFLRSSGAVLAGTYVLSGTASASHIVDRPDHVTLSYDQAYLETYRPRLVIPPEERSKLIGIYGWIASSPEFDTNVCVYWASYTHQDGALGNLDSHYGDHEPISVEVDKQTGEVVRVWASIYHWLKGQALASETQMYEDTHPHLKVVSPWHQYTLPGPAEDGQFYEVKSLLQEYGNWLKNGLETAVHPGASTNPWIMKSRGHWWRNTNVMLGLELPFSIDAGIVKTSRLAGIGTVGTLT